MRSLLTLLCAALLLTACTPLPSGSYDLNGWRATAPDGTEYRLSGSVDVTRVDPVTTPTATPVPPTATPIPPTATPVPPTPTPQTVAGVPVCQQHDPSKWHGVMGSEGGVQCTFTHEHKDDPHLADAALGPPAYELSHPWETPQENLLKHRVYAWYVAVGQPCVNNQATTGRGDLGFSDLRVQAHADGVAGALTRVHSYWAEGLACDERDPAYHGTLRLGGHLDFGKLLLIGGPNGNRYLDLAVDTPTPGTTNEFCQPASSQGGNRRQHTELGGSIKTFTWYGTNTTCHDPALPPALVAVNNLGLLQEDWGPIDPTSPNNPVLFFGGLSNGSWAEVVHIFSIRVPDYADTFDGLADGLLNYRGYTNRWGQPVGVCPTEGLDCVPFEATNLKVGFYEFRQGYVGLGGREHDVLTPSGQSTIQYPN